jgi:hypothetical protein
LLLLLLLLRVTEGLPALGPIRTLRGFFADGWDPTNIHRDRHATPRVCRSRLHPSTSLDQFVRACHNSTCGTRPRRDPPHHQGKKYSRKLKWYHSFGGSRSGRSALRGVLNVPTYADRQMKTDTTTPQNTSIVSKLRQRTLWAIIVKSFVHSSLQCLQVKETDNGIKLFSTRHVDVIGDVFKLLQIRNVMSTSFILKDNFSATLSTPRAVVRSQKPQPCTLSALDLLPGMRSSRHFWPSPSS